MSGARAQTTLDFAIGIGLFLLALAFVLAFVPTVFDPFSTGSSTSLVVADRAASALAGDLLAPSTAGTASLSPGCVAGFVDANQTLADEECANAPDVDDLDGALSLGGRNVNVTIHALNSSTNDPPAEIDWRGDTFEMTRSNSDSIPSDVAVAVRTVRIEGEQYRLTVQVW